MSVSQSVFRLDGKVAVITGASGGIGRAVALKFAAAGANVVLHANRHPQRAIATVKTINTAGGTASMLTGDFSQPLRVEKFVSGVFSMYPQVDIWINAAGVDLMTPQVRAMSFEERLALLWQVDVSAAITASKSAATQMKEGGCILFFSWDGVSRGMEGETAQLYGMAKGAIAGFSRSFAQSLAPKIRVCTISPGWIKTEWGESAPPEFQKRAVAESLMNRWGTAEDVANVALFVVSEEAAFLNAVDVPINGGFRSTPSSSKTVVRPI